MSKKYGFNEVKESDNIGLRTSLVVFFVVAFAAIITSINIKAKDIFNDRVEEEKQESIEQFIKENSDRVSSVKYTKQGELYNVWLVQMLYDGVYLNCVGNNTGLSCDWQDYYKRKSEKQNESN